MIAHLHQMQALIRMRQGNIPQRLQLLLTLVDSGCTMLSLKPLVELQIHRWLSEYITALVWAPVGNRLAIASEAGEVGLWQEDFQETILQTASGASIDALGFSGQGQWLAAAGQAGKMMLWRLSTDSLELVETLT